MTSARLRDAAGRYFADVYQMEPSRATEMGIHNVDDQLGNYSPSAIIDFVAKVKRHRADLERIEAGQLNLLEQGNLALLRADVEMSLLRFEQLNEWQRNPDYYLSSLLHALYLLCVRDFVPLAQRVPCLIARLHATPQFLTEAANNLKNPPRVFTTLAIESAEEAVDFFQGHIPELAKLVPGAESELLSANGEALVALTNFIDFLKTKLLARSRGHFAIGKRLFENMLRVQHMVDLSCEDLLEIGQEEFARTKAALEKTASDIDENKPWLVLVRELRRHHPSAGALLDSYREELSRLRAFVSERRIVTLPAQAALEIVNTPSFARSTTPYAAYLPPAAFENTQLGQFWVTPVTSSASRAAQEDQLAEHNFHSIPFTAIHEAYPGHHVQIVSSNLSGDDIRKRFSSTIFCEGWALYCEQMMVDQGYLTDKRARLFQLKDQLWRAARIIIDVGLHTRQMSVAQAVRLLVDEVYLSQAGASSEVRRYTMTPTQPMSYTLGKLEILRLRDEYRELPLIDFHDLLLTCGTVPPAIIRREFAAKAAGAGKNRPAIRQAGE